MTTVAQASETFRVSWKALASQPLLPLFSSIIEILFFVVYGFVTQFFRTPMLVHAQNLVTVLGQLLQSAGERYETPSMAELVLSPTAKPYFLGLVGWMALLAVFAFIVYVLFHGTLWHLASGNRKWSSYLKQFALLNAVWFIVLGILRIVNDIIDLRSAFLQSVTRTPGWVVPQGIRLAVIILALYFVFISYAELRNHSWWKAFTHALKRGTMHVVDLFPAILVLVILVLAVHFVLFPLVLTPLIAWSAPLGYTLSLAILGPLLFWARVYMSKTLAHDHVRQ